MNRRTHGIFDELSVIGTEIEGFGATKIGPDGEVLYEDDQPATTGTTTTGGGILPTTPKTPATPVYVPPVKTVAPVAPVAPKPLAFYEGDFMGIPKIAWYGAGAILAVVLISKAMKKPASEGYGY